MHVLTQLKSRAKQLKSEAQALIIAYTDKRTPVTAKILIGLTVGYLSSPIDLIPDFIPILGFVDDLMIVPILISVSLRLIPSVVMEDARHKARNNSEVSQRKNSYFGIAIIALWLLLAYFGYEHLSGLWK